VSPSGPSERVTYFPALYFVLGCTVVSMAMLTMSGRWAPPVWLLAGEIFGTVLGLFLFGSFRYRIHKNALTYGMALVIVATFFAIWWPTATLRTEVAREGWSALFPFLQRHLLSWHGLEHLIHADTMLFILGLTLFVAVVAQTRLLESIAFRLLRANAGAVLPTVVAITAIVAFASGILDGVSMIGLTIRTLVVLLFLANAPAPSVRFAVMLCTIVTTVCGIWLAYGEPPNLIMKANLQSPTGEIYLTDGFFLRYCLPAAIASYVVVAWHLWRRFRGLRVDLAALDILDVNVGTVRFLQAARHGRVYSTAIELLEEHESEIGEDLSERTQAHVQHGEPFGVAMVREGVPEALRRQLLGHYASEELAESLDRHYQALVAGDLAAAKALERSCHETLRALETRKVRAQKVAMAAIAVFVVLLVTHAVDHRVPLFVASFAGFLVSLGALAGMPRIRRLALHEGREEYAEYYFLFPLFLSISLLTRTGFFDRLSDALRTGVAEVGQGHVAAAQFAGATLLSAILDNNVVADFGSRAILEFDRGVLYLFALAQIAGYAAGGCWTHIGSAQSVVAFAFLRRDVDEDYTPMQWVREMTPPVLQVAAVLLLIIYGRSLLL
jgi:Na+/H+ antiporter NhaD/arsenite permease-like protein